MSTVPELLSCEGSATTAAALSVITNVWRPDEKMGGHDEVLEASKAASKRLDTLFRRVLSAI
jgi:purine nucleoside phosphorylase